MSPQSRVRDSIEISSGLGRWARPRRLFIVNAELFCGFLQLLVRASKKDRAFPILLFRFIRTGSSSDRVRPIVARNPVATAPGSDNPKSQPNNPIRQPETAGSQEFSGTSVETSLPWRRRSRD